MSVLRDYGLEDVFTIEGDHGDMWYLEKIFLPESDIIQVCNVFILPNELLLNLLQIV